MNDSRLTFEAHANNVKDWSHQIITLKNSLPFGIIFVYVPNRNCLFKTLIHVSGIYICIYVNIVHSVNPNLPLGDCSGTTKVAVVGLLKCMMLVPF